MSNKVRVLLDTDANNEIDDQHAIAYLLLSGDAFLVEDDRAGAGIGSDQ